LRKLLLPISGKMTKPNVEKRGTYKERMSPGAGILSEPIEGRRAGSRIFDP
jgi:hypothetical protein